MTRETRYMLNKLNRSYSAFLVGLMFYGFMAAVAGAAAVKLYEQHGGRITWGF